MAGEMRLIVTGLAVLTAASCANGNSTCDYKVLAEWTKLEFKDSSNIEPEHNLISSARRYRDTLYISVPRWKSGVVFTLTTLDLRVTRLSPPLSAFPSVALNKIGDCMALQNVDAIEIDPSGRLWIADSGQTAPFSNPNRKCPPKLIVWDLNLNQELVHHHLPSSGQPLFKQMVVDLSLGLQHSFAYISDFNSGSIFVYSLSSNTSWSIQTEQTQPANSVWNIGQFQPFYLRAGVYGLALIPDENIPAQNQLIGSRLGEAVFTCQASQLQKEGLASAEKLDSWVVDKPGHAGGLASSAGGEVLLVTLDTSQLYTFNTTEVEGGWTSVCELPAQYTWVDSPSLDQDGNLIMVSNRFHDFTRDNIKISPGPIFSILSIPMEHHSYMTRHVQYSSSASRNNSARIFLVFIILVFLSGS